jgi:hypothetical protein
LDPASTLYPNTGVDAVPETSCFILEFRKIDNVQETTYNKRRRPSSESFGVRQMFPRILQKIILNWLYFKLSPVSNICLHQNSARISYQIFHILIDTSMRTIQKFVMHSIIRPSRLVSVYSNLSGICSKIWSVCFYWMYRVFTKGLTHFDL